MSATIDIPRGADEDIVFLAPDELIPWPELNPRRHFPPEKMAELRASVAKHGVLQNIVVHETGTAPRWVVAGESRWRVAMELGVPLPCRIRTFTEAEALRIALLENLARNDLRPTEEARGFRRLLDLEPGLTEEALGEQIGKSQQYVSSRIRLLKLPEGLQVHVDAGTIPPSHARDFLLPWADAEPAVAQRFFGIFAAQLVSRPDASEPTSKAWISAAVEQLTKVLRPTAAQPPAPPAAAAKPAAKPAATPKAQPAATEKATSGKPASTPTSKAAPPVATEPAEEPSVATALDELDGPDEPFDDAPPQQSELPPAALDALRKAVVGGEAAQKRWQLRAERGMTDTDLERFLSVELGTVGRRLSDGTNEYAYRGGVQPAFWWGTGDMRSPPTLAGPALLAAVRQVLDLPAAESPAAERSSGGVTAQVSSDESAEPATESVEPATESAELTPEPTAPSEPAPAAAPGLFGQLLPILGDYVVTLTISRPNPDGDVCLLLTPRSLADGAKPLAPLALTRSAAALDTEVPPELEPFLAALPRRAKPASVAPEQTTLV